MLQLSGNISSREIDELGPNVPQAATIRVGEQVHSVPEQAHRLAVKYQRPLGASGLDLTFIGSYSFTDEQGDVSDTQLGRMLIDRQLTYWKRRLADAPATVPLPLDQSRSPIARGRGRACHSRSRSNLRPTSIA